MNAIEIRGLSKSFRSLYAVDNLDMTVPVRVGALIENAGCFPNSSVWDNLMIFPRYKQI